MSVVKYASGVRCVFGGQEHHGWLPPGAATPLPTPEQSVQLNIKIQWGSSGYLLIWQSEDGSHAGDTWHESLADAIAAGQSDFGIAPDGWKSP